MSLSLSNSADSSGCQADIDDFMSAWRDISSSYCGVLFVPCTVQNVQFLSDSYKLCDPADVFGVKEGSK